MDCSLLRDDVLVELGVVIFGSDVVTVEGGEGVDDVEVRELYGHLEYGVVNVKVFVDEGVAGVVVLVDNAEDFDAGCTVVVVESYDVEDEVGVAAYAHWLLDVVVSGLLESLFGLVRYDMMFDIEVVELEMRCELTFAVGVVVKHVVVDVEEDFADAENVADVEDVEDVADVESVVDVVGVFDEVDAVE